MRAVSRPSENVMYPLQCRQYYTLVIQLRNIVIYLCYGFLQTVSNLMVINVVIRGRFVFGLKINTFVWLSQNRDSSINDCDHSFSCLVAVITGLATDSVAAASIRIHQLTFYSQKCSVFAFAKSMFSAGAV